MENDSVWRSAVAEVYATHYLVKLSPQAHGKISQELMDELRRAASWKDDTYKNEVVGVMEKIDTPAGMFGFNVHLTFDHMTLIQRVMEEGLSHTVSDPTPGTFKELNYLYEAFNNAVESQIPTKKSIF